MRRSLAILITKFLVVLLLLTAPSAAWAIRQRTFAMGILPVGVVGFSSLMHYLYKNSPSQRVRGYPENLTMGEYYLALYGGAGLMPSQDWTFASGYSAPIKGLTAQGVTLQPGVVVGIKFGRYFNALPYFGLEMETNYSRNIIRGQTVSLSRGLPSGATSVFIPTDSFYIWCMQTNLLARYGFLADKECPFGRLQPYIGLGTGFEIIYGFYDSAKNFSIATQAGIRYMATSNLGIFLEYKFSYQFDVEYEAKRIFPNQIGIVTFDVPNNRIVFGVAYHFKNLFGN